MKTKVLSILFSVFFLTPLAGHSQDKEDPPTLYETMSWLKEQFETMNLKDLNYLGDRIFYEEFDFVGCECKVDFSGIKLDKNPERVKAHRTIYHFSLEELDKCIQNPEVDAQLDLMTYYRNKNILVNKSVEFEDYGWKDYPKAYFAQVGLPVADSALRSEIIERFNYAIELCYPKKK